VTPTAHSGKAVDFDSLASAKRGQVQLAGRPRGVAWEQDCEAVPQRRRLGNQAAELLNVSCPFLIGLLDTGDIEYRRVGKHRRIRAQSLMSYMAADDQFRRESADVLTWLDQEMGLL
jgi:excisionase family DNA binding protein